MNRTTKITFSTLLMLLLATLSWTDVVAQQSDYETQQNFRSEYNRIVNSIDNATSSGDINRINQTISDFVSEFREHTSIINSAIYPETAQERIDALRSRVNATRDKIAQIEELDRRINDLNRELDGFRGELAERSEELEALQRQLRESQASERRVSGLARQYRESLQERDKFVTAFISELTRKYRATDASTEANIAAAIEQLDDNPVDLLRTILGEYVNYANQATGLTPPEYMSMKAQHDYFSEWWRSIGEDLTDVFAESPVQSRQEITDLLGNWSSAIENRIWGSISDDFSANGIVLSNFSSSSQLYDSILDYVSSATERARNQNSQEDVENFRSFISYWNGTVKGQWGDLIIASGVLSYEQIAGIDSQLDAWNEAAIPTSNLMLILFLASIAVIIGLIISLARKRSGSSEPSES